MTIISTTVGKNPIKKWSSHHNQQESEMQYLDAVSKTIKWSLHFQGKPFSIILIQVYALTSNAGKAEVEQFYEDLQYLLELTPQKDVLFIIGAAAKSLQSCPTLCDPTDGSPPGSAIPGILQARTLEWVAISFSNAWKWKVKVKSLSRVRLLVTPWTAAHQAPLSMGFPRQEYRSGVPLHYRGLEYKSRKSRNTWGNRQI